MQLVDLPNGSDPLPPAPLLAWLCGLEDACVQQDVERVSVPFIERNMMPLLRAVDDARAAVAGNLRQSTELWRQQRGIGMGAQPQGASLAPLHLQHAHIDVPPFLPKACEALLAAGRFVDAVVRARCADDGAFTHRAVRAMQFGTCVPLLMRIASLVLEAAPSSHGSSSPAVLAAHYSAVTLPPSVSALAEAARGAASSLLKTRVGGQALHYLHLSRDMMRACDTVARHLLAVAAHSAAANNSASARVSTLRAQGSDEATKHAAAEATWLAHVASAIADLHTQSDALRRSMTGGGVGGVPGSNGLSVPVPSYGPPAPQPQQQQGSAAALAQVDAVSPQQYIAFLRSFGAHLAAFPALFLRSYPALKRACDAYAAKVPTLCAQLEGSLQQQPNTIPHAHQPPLQHAPPRPISASHANALHYSANAHTTMQSGGAAQCGDANSNWLSGEAAPLPQQQHQQFASAGNPHTAAPQHPQQQQNMFAQQGPIANGHATAERGDAVMGPPPEPVAAAFAATMAARAGARAAGSPPPDAFPDAQSLAVSLNLPSRPPATVDFIRRCHAALQATLYSRAPPLPPLGSADTFCRETALAQSSSALFGDHCAKALGPHAVSPQEAEGIVGAAAIYYGDKCTAFSSALLSAQRHNAHLAGAIAHQKAYTKALETALSLVRSVATEAHQSSAANHVGPLPSSIAVRRRLQAQQRQQQEGRSAVALLLARVAANETELCVRMGLPVQSPPTAATAAGPSAAPIASQPQVHHLQQQQQQQHHFPQQHQQPHFSHHHHPQHQQQPPPQHQQWAQPYANANPFASGGMVQNGGSPAFVWQ